MEDTFLRTISFNIIKDFFIAIVFYNNSSICCTVRIVQDGFRNMKKPPLCCLDHQTHQISIPLSTFRPCWTNKFALQNLHLIRTFVNILALDFKGESFKGVYEFHALLRAVLWLHLRLPPYKANRHILLNHQCVCVCAEKSLAWPNGQTSYFFNAFSCTG